MSLLASAPGRTQSGDLWLGGTTAMVAGIVNVCSVIAFFAFSSNVTGHVAVFVEELVKGHWYQLGIVLIWLLCFLGGAATANFSVHSADKERERMGAILPLVLELALLLVVAFYGSHHYAETLSETEVLVALLLFAMGTQNGLVATVSKGLVKTTHLTGLMTDLGMELSMMSNPRLRRDPQLRFKLKLHLLILGGYLLGGILGGLVFLQVRFMSFYLACALLAGILLWEVVLVRQANGALRAGATVGEN